MPETIKLVISDFDGVITDDRVWMDENGKETVAASTVRFDADQAVA